MSDDFEEDSKPRRRWDDRREWHGQIDRPTVLTIFKELGYDLWRQDDLNRLRNNLEYAQRARERDETIRSRRLGWFVSAGIAILSTVVTVFGEWIVSKFR